MIRMMRLLRMTPLAIGLLAAACGDDNGGDSSATSTTAAGTGATTVPATTVNDVCLASMTSRL